MPRAIQSQKVPSRATRFYTNRDCCELPKRRVTGTYRARGRRCRKLIRDGVNNTEIKPFVACLKHLPLASPALAVVFANPSSSCSSHFFSSFFYFSSSSYTSSSFFHHLVSLFLLHYPMTSTSPPLFILPPPLHLPPPSPLVSSSS